MRSRCNLLLLSTFAFAQVAIIPALAQPEDSGADLPPPPPRAQGREVQPGTWRQPEFNSQPGGGAGRFGGRFGQGQMMRGRGGGGMGGVIGPIDLRPLNLTEEQKQKIQTLRQGTAESVKQIRLNLRSARSQMKDMMFDPKATEAQIRKKREEVRLYQDKMDELLVNDFLKMRGVLTKEQLNHLPEVKPQGRSGKGGFAQGDGGHALPRKMPSEKISPERIPPDKIPFEGPGI